MIEFYLPIINLKRDFCDQPSLKPFLPYLVLISEKVHSLIDFISPFRESNIIFQYLSHRELHIKQEVKKYVERFEERILILFNINLCSFVESHETLLSSNDTNGKFISS